MKYFTSYGTIALFTSSILLNCITEYRKGEGGGPQKRQIGFNSLNQNENSIFSIWQLERQAKEGLTNGLGDSPTDELKDDTKQLPGKRSR